ncbi:MAG: hypothetical protein KC964_06235 [Candidatus Omnitrophica bacterium]|nr:hypothetical protein [Candidatus Omnitrophota bacterium]
MNTIVPIATILFLGGVSALILRGLKFSPWVSSIGGALIGTFAWTVGIWLFLWVMAPNELEGGILLAQVVKIFFTALVASSAVAFFLKPKPATHVSATESHS